jgi:hypothetical protein
MSNLKPYFGASRHPWPSFVFIFPLIVIYEVGVICLGGTENETLRNGADYWLRCGLRLIGLKFFWVPPVLLLLVFLIWNYARWSDRPGDMVGVLSGMGIESVCFALGLWGLSRILAPLMRSLGYELALPPGVDSALRQLVPYVGAGIYEEALFRMVLFSLIFWLLRKVEVAAGLAALLAAAGSASLFSAAHHVGPYGQAYGNFVFFFRLVAGVYFAYLYHLRGIGIAVGTHACYNVMISVGTA